MEDLVASTGSCWNNHAHVYITSEGQVTLNNISKHVLDWSTWNNGECKSTSSSGKASLMWTMATLTIECKCY